MKTLRLPTLLFIIAVTVASTFALEGEARAQEAFIGEVRIFAGNFAPRGWAFCDGQLLPISENQALFSLLGTLYGGDGRTTFAVPDLRGRVPVHTGEGPGLDPVKQGQKLNGGTVTVAEGDKTIKNPQAGLGVRYIICLQGIFPSRR
jgi:microcystin-dependent protein